MNKVAGLIITAGRSSRMGIPKALLRFEDHSFLTSIIDKLSPVCDEIYIVLGYKGDQIEEATLSKLNSLLNLQKLTIDTMRKINFVTNEKHREGMFSSLKKGIESAVQFEWILYHFVDQPGIPGFFYNDFIKERDSAFDWIQPVYDNYKGHPLLLHRTLFERILNLSDNSTLKQLSEDKNINRKYWHCDHPEVLQDFDSPIDLAESKIKLDSIKERNEKNSR